MGQLHSRTEELRYNYTHELERCGKILAAAFVFVSGRGRKRKKREELYEKEIVWDDYAAWHGDYMRGLWHGKR